MVLDDFAHEAPHGASGGSDNLKYVAAVPLVSERALKCFYLSSDAANAVQELVLISEGVCHCHF